VKLARTTEDIYFPIWKI